MTAHVRAVTSTVDGLAVTRRRPPEPDPGMSASRPTVILVHGAMDRAASFGRVMRRLSHLDVLALDRRGYAGSLGAGVARTLADHVRDLCTVIDWTGASRVVLVGHSLGATIALRCAATAGPRVVSVGAFEPPVPELDGSRERIGGGAIEVGLRSGAEEAAEVFYRRMVGDATWDRLRDRDRAARRAEGPALLAELVDLRDGTARTEPADIDMPMVLGVGGLSAEQFRSGAEALHDLVGGSRLVEIAGAGHGAHLTHAGEFARYVQDVVAAADTGADPSRGANPFSAPAGAQPESPAR